MNNSGIYKWTSPSGKGYVGQAQDLPSRKREFLNENNADYAGDKLRKARKQYPDFSQWVYEVLEECSIELLDEREKYWIRHYDTYHNGYNLTEGGTSGTKGYHHRDDTKEKIAEKQRAAAQRKTQEERVKNAVYASSFVDRDNPEYRKNLSQSLMGHVESKETRSKISKSHIELHGVSVVKYDLKGNYVDDYPAISEAAKSIMKPDLKAGSIEWERDFKSAKSGIRNCLKIDNPSLTARGFIFKRA